MRIAVLTSGGDAPGMNAAVRTVTIAGLSRGHEVLGIRNGYEGLLAGDAAPLGLGDVDGITRVGGTILGSSRSSVFPTPAGQTQAKARLRELGVEGLVAIGGNGTLAGAHLLGGERPCTIVGIPASIDNDVGHSGMSVGADTAVNTIVEACDRISDTARAHRRAFVVEVMGRRCGFLAMRAGIASEAEAIVHGEALLDDEALVAKLRAVLQKAFAKGSHKRRVLIVKAEGVSLPCVELTRRLREHLDEDAPGVDIRETVLGHVVRGGNPSALDRTIAQRLGYGAVIALEQQAHDVMLAWEVPFGHGVETADPSVRVVPLSAVLAETERLLDGTSPVVVRRLELLRKVEDLLAM
jgi:6-phosphofructokinase 1